MMKVIEIGFLVVLVFSFIVLQILKILLNYAEQKNKGLIVLGCMTIISFILIGIYLYTYNKTLFYIIMCYENNMLYTFIRTQNKQKYY